jgi:NADPH:quinone reductase-like Zn-dependent oxidoreductase
LSILNYGGVAAISGLARSADLPTTVMPFILRGVTLAGVDSVMLRIDKRRDLWQSIATDLMPRHLDHITRDISILEVPDTLRTIVGGGVTGRTRVVVKDGF